MGDRVAQCSGASKQEKDFIVCGSCYKEFFLDDILAFMQHKKYDCDDPCDKGKESPSRMLLCQSCPRKFNSPWRLLQHAEHAHNFTLYKEEIKTQQIEKPSISSTSDDSLITKTATVQTSNSGVQTETPTLVETSPMDLLAQSNSFQKEEDKNAQLANQPLICSYVRPKCNANPPTSIENGTHPVTSLFPHLFDANHLLKGNITQSIESNDQVQKGNTSELQNTQLDKIVEELDRTLAEYDEQFNYHGQCTGKNIGNGSLAYAQSMVSKLAQEGIPNIHTFGPFSNLTSNSETPNDAKDHMLSTRLNQINNMTLDQQTSKENNADITNDNKRADDNICCNNQACGITLMPVTHEEPLKCCLSEVPKKRKLHMQTKHVQGLKSNNDRNDNVEHVLINMEPTLDGSTLKSTSGITTSMKQSYDQLSIEPSLVTNSTQSMTQNPTFSSPVPILSVAPMTSNEVNFEPSQIDIGFQQQDIKCVSGFQPTSLSGSVTDTLTVDDTKALNILPELSTDSISQPQNSKGKGPKFGTKRAQNITGVRKRKYPTSRPFKCEVCGQAFNQRIHLQKHQSKHTGKKPFKCSICDYSTVEKSHLKVHMRIHTGEKPFKCPYCDYATAQNSTLKIHIKRHHQDKDAMLECNKCDFLFENLDLLELHLKDLHSASTSENTASLQDPTSTNQDMHDLNDQTVASLQTILQGSQLNLDDLSLVSSNNEST